MLATRDRKQKSWTLAISLLVAALAASSVLAIALGAAADHAVRSIPGETGSPTATVQGSLGEAGTARTGVGSNVRLADPSPAVNSIIARVPVGSDPLSATYDAANGYLYVANSDSNNVSVISGATNALVTSIPVGAVPVQPTYDSVNGFVYVPNDDSSNVTMIAGGTDATVADIAVGSSPWIGTVDTANGKFFVPNQISDTVSVISGASVVATIPVGTGPLTPAYDPANGDLYVTNSGTGNVSVISGTTDQVVATLPSEFYANPATYDASNGDVYVANYFQDNVTVISGATNTIVANVNVGVYPQTAAVDPSTGAVYVANYLTANVSVISATTNKVVASPAVTTHPQPPAYDGANGDLYVVSYAVDNLSILSGATNELVATIGLGANSETPTFDPANACIYVSVYPQSVLVIAGGVNVSVTESGLRTGTSWSATFGGVVGSTTAPTLVFTVLPGSYSYLIEPVAGYSAFPSSGEALVGPSSYQLPVTFTSTAVPVFTVWINETGLPSGTSWSAIFAGVGKSTSGASLTFTVAAGTYAYQVLPAGGYDPSPSSGTAFVGGAYEIAATYSSAPSTAAQVNVAGYNEGFTVAVAVGATALAFAVATLLLVRRAKPPA